MPESEKSAAVTTCPTCGGAIGPAVEATEQFDVPTYVDHVFVGMGQGHRVTHRRTTATDPARVAAMEALLREMGEARYTYDDSRRMGGTEWGIVSLSVTKWRDWQTRIAALLPAKEDAP